MVAFRCGASAAAAATAAAAPAVLGAAVLVAVVTTVMVVFAAAVATPAFAAEASAAVQGTAICHGNSPSCGGGGCPFDCLSSPLPPFPFCFSLLFVFCFSLSFGFCVLPCYCALLPGWKTAGKENYGYNTKMDH